MLGQPFCKNRTGSRTLAYGLRTFNYINGKYVLYYTLGHWDLPKNSCIGVVGQRLFLVGPFTDHGKLLDYNSGTMQCIDPCYFEDNGKKYLSLINSQRFDALYNYRQPDPTYVKAEILEG